ncbi:MAG: hypothetical protein JXP73_10335 [Deltaproteobacteria bacterium]|nr:hypothetical protein [Deltaproteobacteria bacterium]
MAIALAPVASCKPSPGKPVGPPDSYLLFVASEGGGGQGAGGPLPVKRANLKTEAVQPIPKLLETGFASEMLRTVYLAGQFLRDATIDGRLFPEPARKNGGLPICLVVGADQAPYARGLSIEGGFLSGRAELPDQPWLGIPARPARDKALVQTLAGRFAAYAAHLVASGGLLDKAPAPLPQVLVDGYRMAMEVVAREWRHSPGPAGVIQVHEGTPAQRALFADIRDNRFVTDQTTKALRPAQDLLASAGVAGTVIYRMAQSRAVASKVAPDAFYAPYAKNRMPPGVSPAAILGTFRNFQAKLLGAWATAVLREKAPKDIADLVEVYGAAFPTEKTEVLRIFVVTTFGGTVEPGGFAMDPKDPQRTLTELTALALEVGQGRKSLHQALAAQPE